MVCLIKIKTEMLWSSPKLIESESVTKEDIGYSLKTFKDVKSLIIYLKTIKDSIKDDNYAALKVYFENERTERLLREITDC